MKVHVFPNERIMGQQAAVDGVALIQDAIAERGEANVVLATGKSQFEVLSAIVQSKHVDWQFVNAFHLDEYVGLPITHPGSFRLYLWKRFVSQLPVPLRSFHYLNGELDARAECERVGAIVAEHPVDVAFVGIGENGHLAFNDPPADFATDEPYIVAKLDEACRQQQLAEGWFKSIDEVPRHAISMSIRQIMKSRHIICSVPDERKAAAVQRAIEGEVLREVPASILQNHDSTALYLDLAAASKCDSDVRSTELAL